MKRKLLVLVVLAVSLLAGTSYLFLQISGAQQPTVAAKAADMQKGSSKATWDTTRVYTGTVTLYDVATGDKLKGASDDTVRILTTEYGSPYRVYLATDRSTALPMSWVTETIYTDAVSNRGCAIGDVDGDGQNEIIIGRAGSPYGLRMIKWSGSAWVTTVILTSTSTYVGAIYDIAIGDADNNPATPNDIVFNTGSYGVMKARWNGATFDTTRILYNTTNSSYYGVAIGDFDVAYAGNEIVTVSYGQRVYRIKWNGATWDSTTIYYTTTDLDFYDVAVGDFDPSNPGAEIAINNGYNYTTYGAILELYGSGTSWTLRPVYTVSNWGSNGEIAVGDFFTTNPGAEIVAVSGTGSAYEARLIYGSGTTWYNEKIMGTGGSTYGCAVGNVNRYRPGNELAITSQYRVFEAEQRLLTYDMAAISIDDMPDTIPTDAIKTLKATVRNNAEYTANAPIPVKLRIDGPLGYVYTDLDQATTTNLPPGGTEQIVFVPDWIVPDTLGSYTIKAWTELAGDEVPANDTVTKVVTVIMPTGACCNNDAPYDCQLLTEADCNNLSNHTFEGPGTNCGPPNPCLPAPTGIVLDGYVLTDPFFFVPNLFNVLYERDSIELVTYLRNTDAVSYSDVSVRLLSSPNPDLIFLKDSVNVGSLDPGRWTIAKFLVKSDSIPAGIYRIPVEITSPPITWADTLKLSVVSGVPDTIIDTIVDGRLCNKITLELQTSAGYFHITELIDEFTLPRFDTTYSCLWPRVRQIKIKHEPTEPFVGIHPPFGFSPEEWRWIKKIAAAVASGLGITEKAASQLLGQGVLAMIRTIGWRGALKMLLGKLLGWLSLAIGLCAAIINAVLVDPPLGDFFFIGEEMTPPGPGELTTEELVIIDVEEQEGTCDANLQVSGIRTFWRITDSTTYSYTDTFSTFTDLSVLITPFLNQSSYEVGDTLLATATVSMLGFPTVGNEALVQMVVWPSLDTNTAFSVPMWDDGRFPDIAPDDGIFTGSLILDTLHLPINGTYQVRFSATRQDRTDEPPIPLKGCFSDSFTVFIRGDATGDGVIDVGDIVFIINYLFKSGIPPSPLAAGDVNCDGVVDIGDIVYLINYLFRGGPPPTCP